MREFESVFNGVNGGSSESPISVVYVASAVCGSALSFANPLTNRMADRIAERKEFLYYWNDGEELEEQPKSA